MGTTKDENHPHPSLPRRGGGNNDAAQPSSPVDDEGIMPPHPDVSTVKGEG